MIKYLFQDLKAFFRGEKRVAPYGARGRVYAPRKPAEENADPSSVNAKAKGKVQVSMRVIRKNGDVEDLGTVMEG